MLNTKPANICTEHEWHPSPWEPGLLECAWCPETREAPVRVVEGVDVPVGTRVVDAGKRAA